MGPFFDSRACLTIELRAVMTKRSVGKAEHTQEWTNPKNIPTRKHKRGDQGPDYIVDVSLPIRLVPQ